MKKRLLLFALAALLVLSALPALAAAPADLNALARYFPADTPMLVSARIDDDFLATINSLAEAIALRFPDANMDQSLQEALDEAVQRIYPDGDFQTTVRPWLGNTVSVAPLSFALAFDSSSMNDDEIPVLIAVSIKDSAAALDFIVNGLNYGRTPFFQTTGDGYTLLVVEQTQMPASLDGAQLIVVRDDALLLSANTDTSLYTPDSLPAPSLLDQPQFSAALGLLPADSYNMTIYADMVNDILAASASFDADMSGPGMLSMLEQIGFSAASVGPQVIGFTILDNAVLTIDSAQSLDPTAAPLMAAIPRPVNPAFAARIPAGVPLALHGADLKTQLETAAEGFNVAMEAMAAQPGMDAAEVEEAREQVRKQIAQVNNLFTSFTGLNFTEDVLSWLDGDVIAFIGLNPNLDTTDPMGLMMVFPVEMGIGIEATDPAKAQAAVEGFTKALNQLAAMANMSMSNSAPEGGQAGEITVTTENLAGTTVTVLTLTASDLPWPVELLLGAINSVFALGTRGAVSAIFAADGGLPASATFRAAQAYMLPNPTSVAWLDPAGLLPLADIAEAYMQGPGAADDVDAVRSLLTFIRSGTITSAYDVENNVARARITLELTAE